MQELSQTPEHRMVDRPPLSGEVVLFQGEDRPIPRNPQGRSPWGIILVIGFVVVLIFGGGFFFLNQRSGSSANGTPGGAGAGAYKDQAVIRGNLSLSINTAGTMQGRTYGADFAVSGKVSEIDVSVGQHVKAGQVLAKLDTSTLSSGADTANATLKAPHAGTVSEINGAVGTYTGAGNSSTHFILIVDTSSLQILATINENDITKIASNDRVQFTVGAFGSQQFYGKVTSIAPEGTATNNVVTYPVTMQVDMTRLKGARLLPGMTATVSIITETRSNVLLIPVGVVSFVQKAASQGLVSQAQLDAAQAQARQQLQDLQSSNSSIAQENPSPAVVLESANGQLVTRPVILGLTDGTFYEVLSGLAEGETIATSSGTSNNSTGSSGSSNPSSPFGP